MDDMPVWFREPAVQDDSVGRPGERVIEWLERSTSQRARESRRFLNFNKTQLPASWQPSYERCLQNGWNDVMLELFVGRTLQLLGASIEVEAQVTTTGKRPDFRAMFADGTVIVEATIIETNGALREQMSQNESLVQVVSRLVPPDCSVAVWRLPRLSPNDSKRPFKDEATRLLSRAVEQARITGSAVEVEEEFDSGEFSVTLYPKRVSQSGIVTHGMAAGFDDTEYRIPRAFSRKKKQVREIDYPVILAITASPMGAGLGDFDRALLGHTYERVGFNREVVEVGFDADGIFSRKRLEPPTYAAALVYPAIGFCHVPDPVLYLNARFAGALPEAFVKLRVHYLDEGVGVGVKVPQITNLLAPMQFVSQDV